MRRRKRRSRREAGREAGRAKEKKSTSPSFSDESFRKVGETSQGRKIGPKFDGALARLQSDGNESTPFLL